MNITKDDIDSLNAVITVKVGPEDYQERVDTVLKDHRKKATMPGFRPGKVPMGVIKKMYGRAVLAEEMNKLLSESLYNYINENNLEVLGNPLPKDDTEADNDLETQTEFEFSYELGLAPQFEVNISDKDKFDRYIIQVDDELIDKYILDVRKRYGKVGNAVESSEEDMLKGVFVELDEENNILEGGIMHESTISLEYLEDEDTKKQLIGLKAGDQVVVDPFKVSRGGSDTAAMLGIEAAQLDQVKSQFRFEVKNILSVEPSEINEDLFNKIYGKDQVSTEEEFRQKVSEELEKMLVVDSEKKLQNDVTEWLLDKFNVDLPNEFLKRWLKASGEQPLTDEQIENEYDQYAKGLRWQLIQNRIIRENDLKVTNEEAIERAKLLVRQQYGMYLDETQLDDVAKRILQKEEEARRIFDQLYDDKILDLYKNTFKFKEKEVSFDEFVKLATGKAPKGKFSLNNLVKF